MVLEPGARFREPFDYDMSGAALDPRERNGRRSCGGAGFIDQAGIRPGDALLVRRPRWARPGPDASLTPGRLHRARLHRGWRNAFI
jgi:hypothetical protein